MNDTRSVFKSETGRRLFEEAYARTMERWTVPYETFSVGTSFGRIRVIASGPADGKPVVLLHGMTANSGMWADTMPALRRFRTYCLDTPGDFSLSEADRPLRTRDDCAAWLDQTLASLGIGTTALIGHSMGGWLAANYAIARPGRIERLALLAPIATILPVPWLTFLWRVYPALLMPGRRSVKRAWDWFLARGNELPPAVLDQIVVAYTHCRIRLAVVPSVFPTEEWAGVTAPVLFLVGEEERIYRAGEAVKRAAAAIPHAETQSIARAGHCLMAEQAGRVNEAIERFLRT
ncbi:alpha/beta fold hydrolase [Paenibacillus flagellatus]|uniref:AB hydrolase-1 domain-containing protein n=1 Tax=Paenibacillus flagellatus TaxID=2211139 RepID=A0A2V5K708_9BACL|nr:alpha/beta hydrolase [Paenibacillus flagellatus]PYI55211.1 hypothetical protein DLM86_11870 [Paenibacillus flagellatus]